MIFERKRKDRNRPYLNIYETSRLAMGFTENHFQLDDLACFVPYDSLKSMTQIHSAIIRFPGEIGPDTEGDGIFLEEPGIMAVIRTADCTPLFFWDIDGTIGGVLHIGWQGLYKGIEGKLTALLNTKSYPLQKLRFLLGPAIEKNCYEVGRDLFEKFEPHWYRDRIFTQKSGIGGDGKGDGKSDGKNDGKYLMNIKKGISLSLQEKGVAPEQIEDTRICTFCEAKRFPSYRRDNGCPHRVYNFFLLKSR